MAANGVGDGAADTIILNATNGDDVITIVNDNGVITVKGLGADVTITDFDANDRIVINGLGGDDVIEASGLSGMQLTANGGDGDDVLIGSAGNDMLNGEAGDDVLIGGPGPGRPRRRNRQQRRHPVASRAPPVQRRTARSVHGIELRHGRRQPWRDAVGGAVYKPAAAARAAARLTQRRPGEYR